MNPIQQQRDTVAQDFNPAPVAVTANPTPLSGAAQQRSYIDSFLVCLYTTAANSVFLGGASVTTTTGIEIPAGVSIQFSLSNERPLYELSNALMLITDAVRCENIPGTTIPFVYWDMSQIFAIAAANTSLIVLPFKRMFV